MTLTWVPVWFWCIHRDEPCGWSWSPPRRESHQVHWPEPLGQTASCPERRHCSLGRRGRSGKNHSPSQCWWPEAAGRGRCFLRFPCEGFLEREECIKYLKGSENTFLQYAWGDGIWQEHNIFCQSLKRSGYSTWYIFCIFCSVWAPLAGFKRVGKRWCHSPCCTNQDLAICEFKCDDSRRLIYWSNHIHATLMRQSSWDFKC